MEMKPWSWLVDMFTDKPEPVQPSPMSTFVNGAMPIRKRGLGATPSTYQVPVGGVRG